MLKMKRNIKQTCRREISRENERQLERETEVTREGPGGEESYHRDYDHRPVQQWHQVNIAELKSTSTEFTIEIGLPVTQPNAFISLWPMVIWYVSAIQLISLSPEPMSGAGTSMPGPAKDTNTQVRQIGETWKYIRPTAWNRDTSRVGSKTIFSASILQGQGSL